MNIKSINDVEVTLTAQVGSVRMSIKELSELGENSVIEFNQFAGELLTILANGVPIAKGEVVVSNERYGIKIKELIED